MDTFKSLVKEVKASTASDKDNEALRIIADFYSKTIKKGSAPDDLHNNPGSTNSLKWDSLIGGIAERIANKLEIKPPSWAVDKSRFCHPWWFVTPYESLHASAIVNTPPELSNRGVFIHSNSFESI